MTEATKMTAMVTGRQGKPDEPPEHRTNAGVGGRYRAGGGKMGAGEARRPLTATEGSTGERGAYSRPGGTATGGSNTYTATFAAADKAGAGGHYGEKTTAREWVAGQWENLAGESYGVGGGGEGREAYRVTTEPSGVGGD